MKIAVIGQTYLKEINRDKFNILSKTASVAVMTMNKRYDQLFTTHLDPSKHLQIVTVPVLFNGKEPLHFFSPRKFLKAIRSFKPDILHIENPTGSLVLLQTILTKYLVCPKAKIVVFSRLNLPYPHHVKFWFYRLIERFAFRHIDALICGNNDGKVLFRKYGFKKPIIVMPQLGVDPLRFVKKDVSSLREKLGIKKHEFVFGSIGRLVAEKGVDDELKAFASVHNELPHTKLLLVGRGPHAAPLRALADKLTLTQHVIRVDSVNHEDVVDYINLCDVHILASYETPHWKEQFGHILIECMSCGVPVIGSDSGEIPHVIGDAGLVFPSRDIGALKKAMLRMVNDNHFRNQCIAKGLETVHEKYTHQTIADHLASLYESLLSHNKTTRSKKYDDETIS